MSNQYHYYCWVRVVSIYHQAKPAPITTWPYGATPRNGSRPPPRVAMAPGGSRPSGAQIGVWSADEAMLGRDDSDLRFDYGPAFQDLQEAQLWLLSDEGLKWDKDSVNRFLMTFAAHPAPSELGRAEAPAVDGTVRRVACSGGVGQFPEEDWLPEYRHLHERQLPPDYRLFNPDAISALPAPALNLPGDQCEDLLKLKDLRSTFCTQINREAQGSSGAAVPVFLEAGVSVDGPPVNTVAKQLMIWVLDSIESTVFREKVRHNRARPWNCCDETLEPMFPKTHWRYPGHPSYPSGHATIAHTFALLLAERFPDKDLEGVADDVAQRRVIAGVHYPSDSVAGKELARRMVAAMLDTANPQAPKLRKLLNDL